MESAGPPGQGDQPLGAEGGEEQVEPFRGLLLHGVSPFGCIPGVAAPGGLGLLSHFAELVGDAEQATAFNGVHSLDRYAAFLVEAHQGGSAEDLVWQLLPSVMGYRRSCDVEGGQVLYLVFQPLLLLGER
ncbi:hypothetical protein D3C76_1072250 [compost metagenome]